MGIERERRDLVADYGRLKRERGNGEREKPAEQDMEFVVFAESQDSEQLIQRFFSLCIGTSPWC